MDSQSNLINIRFIYEDSNYDIQIGTEEEVLDLKKKIKNEIEKNKNVKVNEGNVSIKLGFPPKTIEGSCDDSKTMKELRISNNEQLRVEIKNLILQNESVKSENINENLQDSSIDYSKYSIYRKVIPANNSCLFNSVNYAINQNANEPQIMRELIAVEIQNNPDIYSEAILDKNPFEYCEWILRNDTWGGGIELSILSKCFQIKIAVANIKNCSIGYFGEDFTNVIFLLYDGIHYDVFVKKENDDGVFSTQDENVKNEVMEIIKNLNKISKFVDPKNYSIKCNVCYQMFKGNEDAVKHSKSTGHINFVQI